jgi:hypothetical protein
MANEIEIPLKLSGVQSLKAELRSLKAAIAEASDPEQMAALAQRAGEVADRIKDANDAVNVFASGSKFEQISNSFGGIKDSLMSLDFEEASEKAKVFSKSLGGLNAADISKSMKGLTSTITTMGGAFVKLGAQILANPIFLLVAVVVAIVAGIVIFLNKIGVLQKAIDFLMIPVNLLIDAFKELTDWLGLTSYAAEENARTMEKANEKAFKSSEKRVAAISDSYDIEIAKAKAAGKDTTQLELDKSKAITDAAKKRLGDARSEYANLKGLSDKDSIERRKALRKRIEEENKLIKDGSKERQMIQIADDAEEKAAEDKKAEEAKQRREAAAKAYKDGKDAIKKEIAVANKLVADSAKTEQQREVDDVKTKYAALIAEAQKYKQDITGLEKARETEIAKINDDAAKVAADKVKAENEKRYAAEDAQFLKLQELTMTADEFKKFQLQIQYDADIAAASGNALLETELTKKLQTDLTAIDVEGNANRKKEQDDADAKVIAAAAAVEEQKRAIQLQGLEVAAQGVKLIASLFEKSKGVQKASVIAESAIGIAKMIISNKVANAGALAKYSAIPGGAALAAVEIKLNNVSTGIGVAANVAATAKALQALGGGSAPAPPSVGGGGGGSAGGGSSVPAFVPGNLFGQGNAANNVGAPNGMESGQNFTVTAVVSETEMTATQSKVNKIMKNSVL